VRDLQIDNNGQYTPAVTPLGSNVVSITNLTALRITNRGRFAGRPAGR